MSISLKKELIQLPLYHSFLTLKFGGSGGIEWHGTDMHGVSASLDTIKSSKVTNSFIGPNRVDKCQSQQMTYVGYKTKVSLLGACWSWWGFQGMG